MSKQEFIQILDNCLRAELPNYEINKYITYYTDYLNEEDPEKEKEKIKELGEPRLIAKSIIEAYHAKKDQAFHYRDTYEYEVPNEEDRQEEKKRRHSSFKINIDSGIPLYYKVVGFLLLMAFFVVLFFIGRAVLFVFIRFIFPVIVIYFVINLIVKLFDR